MPERANEVIADDTATTLLAIEAIKQLKARYCRYLDAKDWATWRGIFTHDFVSDTSEAGGKLLTSHGRMKAQSRGRFASREKSKMISLGEYIE